MAIKPCFSTRIIKINFSQSVVSIAKYHIINSTPKKKKAPGLIKLKGPKIHTQKPSSDFGKTYPLL
ncbi:MAG: hypothetical protein A3H88_00875 [Candidatus Blackburnbacteria bacterium RIFCSPLOWO2_02_FULL_44_9]|uniref:Uncharacterized protein n=1 Tax=Candidatus Blackburnbacteria bacterium RIFCSPHIGHO2_02_FULL_44_20 TaxID=1797516 RepID=A0A1G1V8C1_9BACT|nr:MAG: hypothetical protein A3D26_01000 [Candidatus Blackburnbacteria bacterium RIFCSPHIGHO2_02_FULL_44_20]OGY13969.1 MAG: hypothetical protein A3A62_01260 [Candidatus Blackburnbacteria bacterium RIFCSPLOWO2_01_FULL_44_43]OGY17401.1 MAG: hypothetical protein A3H88_00875 [Candidatus Blackburnbacteria bacterium RIFCSPLOWO2_02_FULL_44_9]